jgi:hypothetical protein
MIYIKSVCSYQGSSYQGSSYYRVTGDGAEYEIEWNRKDADTLSWVRRTYNGTQERFDREVVAAVGTCHRGSTPISDAALTAFHAFIEKAWNEDIAAIERYWKRDGKLDDPREQYPMPALPIAVYWTDDGWKRSDVQEMASQLVAS